MALHVCRGNSRSRWYTEGGYDAIAEKLFGSLDVDAFLLEYDTDRSGGFEPLRLVPRSKTVVLGLVTTKEAKLESQDELRRRIDEAARYRSARKSGAQPAVRLRVGGGGQSAVDRRSVAQAGTGGGDGAQGLGNRSRTYWTATVFAHARRSLSYAPAVFRHSAICFFRNRPFADHFPVRLGDVHRGGAQAGQRSGIQHQIHAAIHDAKHIDAAAAGGLSGNIGAGGDQRLIQPVQQRLRHARARLPNGQPSGVASHFERHFCRRRNDHGQRPGPEVARQNMEARGKIFRQFLRHESAADQHRQGSMDLAALGGEHPSHCVQVQRIGHQHVERFGGNRDDVAAPQVRRRAFNRFRQRMVLIDLYQVSRQCLFS